MTRQDADEAFGPVILATDNYEVRGKEGPDGMHVYSFRVANGVTELPRGFILGSNSLHHKGRNRA